MAVLRKAFRLLHNLYSFKCGSPLLIIESDDWGSLRTNNLKARSSLNRLHTKISEDPYTQLDNLASSEDLSALYEVLGSVKDKTGRPACITANFCMANPDFQKIKSDHFEKFQYEPFYKTIRSKKDGEQVLNLWNEGIEHKFITPQLHGREHLHALAWLSELKAGNELLLKAFDLGVWGIPYEPLLIKRRHNLQAALDIYDLPGEDEFQKKWITESASMFRDYFGFSSKTFIPPAYKWHSRIDDTLKESGVEAIQGIKLQYEPSGNGNKKYRKRVHYTGQKRNDICYLTRNCFFEPSIFPGTDWYSEAMAGIETAFRNQQPAIIGSHRINFIGNLEESNRTNNLELLRNILHDTIKNYPDVQFISSDELLKFLIK